MDIDNQEKLNCADDNYCRIICDICDKFAIDRFCNNHLKSQAQFNIICKSQQRISTSS